MSFRPDSEKNKPLVEAYNTGLTLLSMDHMPGINRVDPNYFNDRLVFTRTSLRRAGQDIRGIINPVEPPSSFAHTFSRTGEIIGVQTGIFTGAIIDELEKYDASHTNTGIALNTPDKAGIPVNSKVRDLEHVIWPLLEYGYGA